MSEYAIVGAGVAGMSVAVLLAEKGHRVTLVEQGATLSPTLFGFQRAGVYFDTGLHYLGAAAPDELLGRLLRRLGVAGSLNICPMKPCFDRYRLGGCPDFAVEFRSGVAAFGQGLVEAFPRERAAIDHYCTLLVDTFPGLAERLCLNPDSPFDLLDLMGPPTLADYLRGITADERLRRVLSAHTVLHGTPPGQVPVRFHAMFIGSYVQSAYFVEGGGRAVVEAFRGRLQDLGVTVRCDSRVEAIEQTAAGAVRGLRLADGSRIAASNCVVTAHPRHLPGWVPEGALGRSFNRRLKRLEDSPQANVAYGVAPGGIPALRGQNLIVDPGAGATGGWHWPMFLSANQLPGEDPVAFSLIVPVRPGDLPDWPASSIAKRPESYMIYKGEVMRRAEHFLRAECRDEMGDFSLVAGATALTFKHYSNSPTGGLYGVRHTTTAWGLSPQTGLDGLFLSGQATLAPGVLGAMLAAFVTCACMPGCRVNLEVPR